MIAIDPEKACYFIIKARQFQAKTGVVEPDPGSNVSDDDFREILEDYGSDPVQIEMRSFLESLNEEETASLLALMWIGRGDYTKDEWETVLEEAKQIENDQAPDYLIGTPLVADYMEEALSALGYSCGDLETDHL
ncbi:DUF3775 domain-containing protein [Rhodospirillaceae bacterium SYSU D60014]|uniref:DUF3775 domain-containing protein n=1 Tax=Virgifigura deserti TaxID=2268457 RepID=UPI000E66A625